MDRTLRAALLAALIVLAAVAGFGALLGFGPTGSVVAGVVTGALAAWLIWGAARRAETFHDPTPSSPSFPGPPDRPDGSPADPNDPAHRRDAEDADPGEDED